MSDSQKPLALVVWILFVGGGLLLAMLTGRLAPQTVPDTASYLNYSFASLDDICRSIRTIGYPLWLSLFKQTIGTQFVPAAQVVVHATAAWWLFYELRQWGLSSAKCVVAAVVVGIGCTPMDHIHVLSTDAIAASVGVMAVVCTLRWSRLRESTWAWFGLAVVAVTAVFIRPAYLFLIPWLLITGAMLRRINGCDWKTSFKSSSAVSVVAVIPIFAWMLLRLFVVGDFGMLPFGHQNLSAILVQLVSDDELKRLDAELGGAIVDEKLRFTRDVGFVDGEVGATMTINARWDDMTYFVVIPAAKSIAGQDTVAVHNAIATLNKKIIWRYPHRYVVWLAKAARQAAWVIAADIMMHPVFLFAIGFLVLMTLSWAVSGRTVATSDCLGSRALAIVALTYMIAGVGFVILTSPPIGRFSDGPAIFLPAWLAVLAVGAIELPKD